MTASLLDYWVVICFLSMDLYAVFDILGNILVSFCSSKYVIETRLNFVVLCCVQDVPFIHQLPILSLAGRTRSVYQHEINSLHIPLATRQEFQPCHTRD